MKLSRSAFAFTSATAPVLATVAVLVAAAAPGSGVTSARPWSPALRPNGGTVAENAKTWTIAAFFPTTSSPVDTPPPMAMVAACRPSSTVSSCDQATVTAIDAARAAEGIGPLSLPKNFASLAYVGQIVAVTNAERTSRDLPALAGPREAIDLLAQSGADRGSDPAGPAGSTWVSNVADGFWTPLQADYQWMYNDGLGGSNADCTAAHQTGCWEHRANILSPWAGSIGAAAQPAGTPHQLVFAELMVKKPQ
jgi:hypothetical protein